ncbi:MAG: 2,3-oxidosqualene cyclase [Deltaproteobacteria bacterium]|nr:2,3-oxidosqualene cyclase [Deltaproteobacteria bacterium]
MSPSPTSSAARALACGVDALLREQAEDGSFEGEVVWCPMLVAQYTMMCHITGATMPNGRREGVLLNFERTRLPSGLWGLHPQSPPTLFVTTLVYVAARLLGVPADDPLLAPARRFIAQLGGVLAIPSWGKFWLSLLGLYGWDGVNAVLPEAWALPERSALHPRHYYCHTRLIYMGMAALYGRRLTAPTTDLTRALREELYPGRSFESIDFSEARGLLHEPDLFAPPSRVLKLLYGVSTAYDKLHIPALRRRLSAKLEERIVWELRTTTHTSISPVSGLLNMLALWARDPEDPDYLRALERFEGWIWEDDVDGARVTGARSVTWDSSFALSALEAAAPHVDVSAALSRGADFLETQQIQKSFPGYEWAYRVDPDGGFCFAGVWHGWPVSDCTAEAIEALMGVPGREVDADHMQRGVRFILRCQNADGGFGSYEARTSRSGLEWMNPAEMFGDSMTEKSYVECCASCISGLARFRERYPDRLRVEVERSIADARQFLLAAQRQDGSFEGVWGVHTIYGTLFGIRGLRASGLGADHPAVGRARDYLLSLQREDGGFGEHWSGCVTGVYRAHEQAQVTQTAWALMALVEAEAPQRALDRAATWLSAAQLPDGSWPKQDMAGVFFHTALLDYVLYRSYFPVWALGLYESKVRARHAHGEDVQARTTTAAAT